MASYLPVVNSTVLVRVRRQGRPWSRHMPEQRPHLVMEPALTADVMHNPSGL